MMAQTTANTAGRTLKRPAPLSDFLPKQAGPPSREAVIATLERAAGGRK